jgi:hypothetical protein
MSEHTPLSVNKTVQLDQMIQDPRYTSIIGPSYNTIKEILNEVQRAICNENNLDKIAPTVLAIKNIDDTMLLFKSAYEVRKSQEKQKQDK